MVAWEDFFLSGTWGAGGGQTIAVRETPGGNSATSATTVTVNLGATTTGGELIVALIGEAAGTTGNLSSVTDSAGGNAFTLGTGFSDGSSNTYLNWAFLQNAPAGITGVKTTLTTGKTHSLQLFVLTGAATTSAQDGTTVTSTDGGLVATHSTGTYTSTNASDIIIAAENLGSTPGVVTDPSAPWNVLTALSEVRPIYQIVSAAGPFSASWSTVNSVNGAAIIMGFKAAPQSGLSQSLSDSVTTSDAATRAVVTSLADTPTFTDSPAKSVAHPLDDTTTMSDLAAKAFMSARSDSTVTIDSEQQTGDLAERIGLSKADSTTITDAETVSFTPHPADSVTMADAVTAGLAQSLTASQADTATITDAATVGVSKTVNLSDTASTSDTVPPPLRIAPGLLFVDPDVGTLTFTPIP